MDYCYYCLIAVSISLLVWLLGRILEIMVYECWFWLSDCREDHWTNAASRATFQCVVFRLWSGDKFLPFLFSAVQSFRLFVSVFTLQHCSFLLFLLLLFHYEGILNVGLDISRRYNEIVIIRYYLKWFAMLIGCFWSWNLQLWLCTAIWVAFVLLHASRLHSSSINWKMEDSMWSKYEIMLGL